MLPCHPHQPSSSACRASQIVSSRGGITVAVECIHIVSVDPAEPVFMGQKKALPKNGGAKKTRFLHLLYQAMVVDAWGMLRVPGVRLPEQR